MAAIARETLGAGWTVDETTNPDAPAIITEPAGLARATASTLGLFETGLDPLDGVILSAFLDPGRLELGARLSVPVVGIAEAAMAEAAAPGRFAVLATTPDLAAEIRRLAEAYGHGDRLAGIVGTKGEPHAVMADPDRLQAALRELMTEAVDRLSVDAVIIGGGPLADAARALAAEAPVPVIEPVPAAARWMRTRLS